MAWYTGSLLMAFKSKRYGNANHMGLSKENDLNEGN